MKELIKRLRAQAKLTRRYCPHEKIKTLEENAADAIEKLQAENERLKKALQEWIDGKCISEKYLLMIGRLQSLWRNNENCIVKLQEQIAELRSVQEWISVKDRLPEKGTRIVAYKGYTFLAKLVGNQWFDVEWNCYRYGVTHWLPLPQPPKGEQQ